jgi:hypothetical protein
MSIIYVPIPRYGNTLLAVSKRYLSVPEASLCLEFISSSYRADLIFVFLVLVFRIKNEAPAAPAAIRRLIQMM